MADSTRAVSAVSSRYSDSFPILSQEGSKVHRYVGDLGGVVATFPTLSQNPLSFALMFVSRRVSLRRKEDTAWGQQAEIKIMEPRTPSHVRCTNCGLEQPSRKEQLYWRTVKAPHLRHSVLWRVRMVYAKCRNPACSHESFALRIPVVARYQRARLTSARSRTAVSSPGRSRSMSSCPDGRAATSRSPAMPRRSASFT